MKIVAISPKCTKDLSFACDLKYGLSIFGNGHSIENRKDMDNAANENVLKNKNTDFIEDFFKDPKISFFLESAWIPKVIVNYLLYRHIQLMCKDFNGLIDFRRMLNNNNIIDSYLPESNKNNFSQECVKDDILNGVFNVYQEKKNNIQQS